MELTKEYLAIHSGFSKRQITRMIKLGVLPGASQRGRYGTYGNRHLALLRQIRRDLEQNVTYQDLAERYGKRPIGQVG